METVAADTSEHSIVDVAEIGAEFGASVGLKMFDVVAVEPCAGSANPVEGPKSQSDFVSRLVEEFERLDKPDAFARLAETLAKVDTLEAAHEQSFFEIGGILSLVLKNAWFAPYPSFDNWARARLPMGRAKARALIHNYDVIAKAGLSAAQFERIGWTKIRVLAPALTRDNAEYWSERAATHSRTQLERLVRRQTAPASAVAPKGSPAAHDEYIDLDSAQQQVFTAALAKAKGASDAKSNAAALMLICASYGGKQSLQERLAEAGPEAAIVAVVDLLSGLGEADAVPLLRRQMQMSRQALGVLCGWRVSEDVETANREFRARLPG